MSATPIGRDSRWYTVVVGVRLTDGLKGTIVQRPSSPALKQYSLHGIFSFTVVKCRFCASWVSNRRIVEEGMLAIEEDVLHNVDLGKGKENE
jgi:hypothetical protein